MKQRTIEIPKQVASSLFPTELAISPSSQLQVQAVKDK